MAIAEVHERFQERTAEIRIDGQRRYTRSFYVRTTDRSDGPETVAAASGVPTRGDAYPGDTGAVAISIQPEPMYEHDRLWKVTVQYDTETGLDQDEPEEENPLDRPAEVEWGFAQYSKPVWKLPDGTAITNSAKEVFDPPQEIDDSRPVLRITRNESSFDPQLAIDMQDGVNEDAFVVNGVTFEAETAKIAMIAAARMYENGVEFWRVVYEIHFRREEWRLEPLDQGYYHLEGTAPNQVQVANGSKAVNEDNKTTGDAVALKLLDGSGGLIDPVNDTPVFLSFDIYKKVNFLDLNLPEIDGVV